MISRDICILCPRECRVDRITKMGFCQCNRDIKVARAALHFWEEPCISGTNGSGTVFFSGCTMKCSYCQNYSISREAFGKIISTERLSEIFLELQEQGAHNINLVTATQYLPQVLEALDMIKGKLIIPVVYNCGGYERVETINELKGYVDIYLPDLKYYNSEISRKYSQAPNYFEIATNAIQEMISQTGSIELDKNGIMKKGVIIRHLVLPGHRKDSIEVLKWLSCNLDKSRYLLSLMSQYTPPTDIIIHKELNRRITSFEYQSVIDEAIRLGLSNSYIQERSSATLKYTPDFSLDGV